MFLELDEGTKFIDVLVDAAIDNQKDSGTSKIGMRTISEKYGIALSKVEDAIKRLNYNLKESCPQYIRKYKLLKVELVQTDESEWFE